MPDDCLFCKIAAGTIPAKIAFENDELLAFYDISPAAPTHILIIPRQHLLNTTELDEQSAPLMGRMMLAATQIAREQNIESSGYRIVTNTGADGGQSVMHLHLHLLGGRYMAWPPG
ncbi:MAG: histidine triad nucleotide-binding protein [Chloroflexota bacterium]